MRILFLTQILPYPLDAGPKIRAYYILRHLSKCHEITLVSFLRSSDSPAALTHLKAFCHQIFTVDISRSVASDSIAYLKSLVTRTPFLIARDQNRPMFQLLDRLIGSSKFDAVHADQLWMAPYALYARSIGQNQAYLPNLILDQHNAVFLIPHRMAANSFNPFTRYLLQREARLLETYESSITTHFDHLIWVSRSDLHAVQVARAKYNITAFDGVDTILPICIDPSDYTQQNKNELTNRLLFIGGLHWPPNAEAVRWFVRMVLPGLRQRLPDVEVLVVGRDPPSDLFDIPNLKLTGYVADTGDVWSSSRLFLVPIQSGSGMRVKILEAWAHGLPVVSTSIGAEGILAQPGENFLLADSPDDFLEAILLLLSDDNLASHIAAAGRRTVEDHYDWHRVYKKLDSISA